VTIQPWPDGRQEHGQERDRDEHADQRYEQAAEAHSPQEGHGKDDHGGERDRDGDAAERHR
jgi:hypothetical protein